MHIEVPNSLDLDAVSFILTFPRFMARRETIRSIWLGNGTNFVGARNELQQAFKKMKHNQIEIFLQETGAD